MCFSLKLRSSWPLERPAEKSPKLLLYSTCAQSTYPESQGGPKIFHSRHVSSESIFVHNRAGDLRLYSMFFVKMFTLRLFSNDCEIGSW